MNSLIVFEVNPPARIEEVKTALYSRGYTNNWLFNNRTFNLPFNCVWRPNIELANAYNDIQGVAQQLGIQLTKCVVIPATPWVAM